ncbi:MAG: 3-hydroxyacyl-CoA dehydrogenase/enoyl-CoA hydratase family protein [Deltaproteobacteria bacterium]|nr:3-hydroxyacyl-CoA dehydrogenase/enoyl-CoA hydratase family protein [Deltaproteobacteria bacterium]
MRKAAVLGAGVMGKGIAAHLANAGIPSLLLDLDRDYVAQGLEQIRTSKPALLYDPADLRLITPGTFDADLSKAAECDWIVEVIIEQLAPKQALYAKLEKLLTPTQLISSNTSGISWARLTEGRSAAFKRRFCITHFFNPVRYLKLVELVGGTATDPAALTAMAAFLGDVLGKGVVYAKDTPSFIANRIAMHTLCDTLHFTEQRQLPIEAIDAVFGPALGRPKTGIYRLLDLVGLDTVAHVARDTAAECPHDEARATLGLPRFYEQMVERKWIGDKTGQGFYRKVKGDDGGKQILALDLATLEYRPQRKFKAPSLGAAREIDDVRARVRAVAFADDEAGRIAWPLLADTLVYAANRIPEIADDIVNIDRAMRWGYAWELGPFETWDALGVAAVAERLAKDGRPLPPIVADVLAHGDGRFYAGPVTEPTYFDPAAQRHRAVPRHPAVLRLAAAKALRPVPAHNDSATLVDLGDGVLCCEFHTKMNAIDEGVLAMLARGLDETEARGAGLVIHNDGTNFCVGANLMLIFLEAQQQNWPRLDAIVRQFQQLAQRITYCAKPVVVAPFQLTLGGGCEIALAAAKIRAAAETYIGLVEVGVGLIPAGGGCKNMLLRMEAARIAAHHPRDTIWHSPADGGPFPKVRRAFETIAFATVATSAKEAMRLGYLRPTDGYTIDRDRVLAAAKADVLALAPDYRPPVPRTDISLPGRGGMMALVNAVREARALGRITEYDQVMGEKLAYVLAGGNRPTLHTAGEQDILDLERETFLQLCGMEPTQARIQHMLMTGKPLRN